LKLFLAEGKGKFKASAPNGKSKGKHEAKSYKKCLEEDIKTLKKLEEYFSSEYLSGFKDLRRITLSNVFLLPSGDSFNLQDVKLPDNLGGIVCVPVKSGKVNLNLYSVGDGVEISPEGITIIPIS
jgi:hypothetical protein